MIGSAMIGPTIPVVEAAEFEAEVEHFRKEAEGAVQFLAVYLSTHRAAAADPAIHRVLATYPLHSQTTLAALQQSAIIALGRIFDQDSSHNIDRLIGLAQRTPGIFSRAALWQRKLGAQATPPNWLEQYVLEAHQPSADDFRALRKAIAQRRGIYEAKYRPLRHAIFAHSGTIDRTEIDEKFAQTNVAELEGLLEFLCNMHGALWDMFANGTAPTLGPSATVGTSRMRDLYNRVKAETEATLRRRVPEKVVGLGTPQ